MAWLTTDAKPIVEGWGRPPDLQAPNIASLVSAILEDRRKREALTGANISDTIKNVRGERQSNELLDAMRAADLIPKDYESGGVGGATYGLKLADQLREKKDSEARRTYLGDLGDAAGGGGDDDGTNIVDVDETQYPLYKTDAQNNIVAVRHIQRGKGGRLIINYNPVAGPIQPTLAKQPSVKDTYGIEKDIEKQIDDLQLHRAIQELKDRNAGNAGVPFARQTDEDKLRQQLEEVRQRRENPPPDRPSSYATPDQIKMARARQALDDPEATPQEKEQARRILSGE